MKHILFKKFLALIEFDKQILSFENDIKNLKNIIIDLEQKLFAIDHIVQSEEDMIKKLRKDIDSQELLMRIYDEKEKIARTRLENCSSAKEFQSLKKENDLHKKKQYEQEELVMQAWNAYDLYIKQFQITKKKNEEIRNDLQTTLHSYNTELANKKSLIIDLFKERENYLLDIPIDWVNAYNRMRATVVNPIVSIINNICSGCSCIVAPHIVLALNQHQMMQCPHCFRLLFKNIEVHLAEKIISV